MSSQQHAHPLFKHLRGNQCQECNSGQLVEDDYKGNRALVCSDCGIPQLQVF